MNKTDIIRKTINFKQEQLQELEKLCDEYDVNLSNLIRLILNAVIKNPGIIFKTE